MFSCVFQYIMPLAVIIVLYYKIYIYLKVTKKMILWIIDNIDKKQDHSLPRANSRARQRKTNNTLFCISLTFCLR